MEEQKCNGTAEPLTTETDKQGRWSEHCKTFLVKALDLDRPKRDRTIFSNRQLMSLEEAFIKNQYLVGKDRTAVSRLLGLSETQVKVWFQNRRTKHKKDNERCGGNKDLKAESKAARNVLKLLEYKTALNYNTLLNQPAKNLDIYTIQQGSNSISSVKYSNSRECVNHLGEIFPTNFLVDRLLADSAAKSGDDQGSESHYERARETVPKTSSVDERVRPWEEFNTVETLKIIRSDSISRQSPEREGLVNCGKSAQSQLGVWNTEFKSSLLENPHLRIEELLNNEISESERSRAMDITFRTADTVEEGTSRNGEDMQQNQTAVINDCPSTLDKSRNEHTQQTYAVNKELEKVATSNFNTHLPAPGFINNAMNASHNYWLQRVQEVRSDTASCRFPTTCSHTISPNKCNSSYLNKLSHQNNITGTYIPNCVTNNVSMNTHYEKSLPNFLYYQNLPLNASLAYQQTKPSLAHEPQQEQAPCRNIKNFNYYNPSTVGSNTDQPGTNLQHLQYMSVYHSYRDGCVQTSNPIFNLGTPQPSFLAHPSMVSLSAQYRGYPITSQWSQSLPEFYQTD